MGILGILMKLLEIRSLLIINLILQFTLTFLAPLRKNTSNVLVTTLLWAAYTVAGLAADYALGLLTHTAIPTATISQEPPIALWASFVLLQVMGPDSITAFSIDDTKSWFRSTFRVFFTCVAVLRAIYLVLPKNRLAVAVFSVFFAGLCKYMERSQSLFRGNLTRFKTFTNPIVLKRGREVQWSLPMDASSRGQADLTRVAFEFFQTFKKIFANVVFSRREWSPSRDYFLKLDAAYALKVVETELNFAYDVLYTKMLFLKEEFGRASRLIAVPLELLAFFMWVSADKREFRKVDVRLTYALVSSAIFFDAISFLMLLLSDWTTATTLHRSRYQADRNSLRMALTHKLILFKNQFSSPRRWSESVSQFSLIMWCTSGIEISPKFEKLLDRLNKKELVYGFRNLSSTRFDDNLRDFIFNELSYRSSKSEHPEVAKQMSSSSGDWILCNYYHKKPSVLTFADTWFAESMEFHKIILLWHVATELCYYAYPSDDHEEIKERDSSKIISSYMAYLLVRDQTILSQVAGDAKVAFQHTCDEVVRNLSAGDSGIKGLKKNEEKVERACKMIIMADSDEEVGQSKDQNSVLQQARRLSKELRGMMDEGINMWEVMSKVWVELLCYAACKCTASEHAGQLCKGGQLLTIVWMLMAHLGLSNRVDQDPN